MRNFQKKGKLWRLMQSKVFLVFLGILIIAFVFNLFSLVSKMEETSRNRKIVEDKIVELEKTKKELNLEINKLNTTEGIEKSIREKFGLAKDGENMILVVDDKNKTDAQKDDNSNRFLDFFNNLFR